MRDRGMVSSLALLVLLLIVGIALFFLAGIMLLNNQDVDITREQNVEQQIKLTASSSSVLQIPSAVLLTEYQGEKVRERVERFAFCRYRSREYGCLDGERVTESDLNDALENRMNTFFQEDMLGQRPYFIRILRNGDEIHAMSRGVETVVRQGRTRPQFGSQITSVRNPVALPGEESASITFQVPLGGMDIESFEGGGS